MRMWHATRALHGVDKHEGRLARRIVVDAPLGSPGFNSQVRKRALEERALDAIEETPPRREPTDLEIERSNEIEELFAEQMQLGAEKPPWFGDRYDAPHGYLVWDPARRPDPKFANEYRAARATVKAQAQCCAREARAREKENARVQGASVGLFQRPHCNLWYTNIGGRRLSMRTADFDEALQFRQLLLVEYAKIRSVKLRPMHCAQCGVLGHYARNCPNLANPIADAVVSVALTDAPRRAAPKSPTSPSRREERNRRISEMGERGCSLREIAAAVGCDKETVSIFLGPRDRSAGLRRHHARRKAEGRPVLPPWALARQAKAA